MPTGTLPAEAPVPGTSPRAPYPIRVLAVEDNSVYGGLLARWVGGQPDMQIVGLATNGRQALDMADALHPDVVLMDVFMPTLDGIEATSVLSSDHPEIAVIAMTAHCAATVRRRCSDAGARAFVPKPDVDRCLLDTIRAVAKL